jgi:hypothetical protein
VCSVINPFLKNIPKIKNISFWQPKWNFSSIPITKKISSLQFQEKYRCQYKKYPGKSERFTQAHPVACITYVVNKSRYVKQ